MTDKTKRYYYETGDYFIDVECISREGVNYIRFLAGSIYTEARDLKYEIPQTDKESDELLIETYVKEYFEELEIFLTSEEANKSDTDYIQFIKNLT